MIFSGLWWLVVTVLNIVLACMQLFVLIELHELGKDKINSFTLEGRVQMLVSPEHYCQILLALLLVAGSHWKLALIHFPLAVFHLHRIYVGMPLVKHAFGDNTFLKTLPGLKRRASLKLVAYLIAFAFLCFALFESIISSVEGEEMEWLINAVFQSQTLNPSRVKYDQELWVDNDEHTLPDIAINEHFEPHELNAEREPLIYDTY
mmetsp:Transcript_42107/g.98787  ORF Transcript_42107/g.98787 Transcript_42107/m.98787 type:complete len:205 (+) Transcript_42107:61-675(+)